MTISGSRPLVDPQLLPFLELLPRLELSMASLEEARANRFALPEDPTPPGLVETVIRTVPGPPDAPDVGVVIHRPSASSQPLPCIFHVHGGGYVLGSVDSMIPVHRPMAADLDCCIVSVDYRLAPETVFPGAVEDGYAALAWVFDHAAELGVDPTCIGLMGESAGGGLAAALALLTRDRGAYTLAFQHLIYPMLDDRTCVTVDPHPLAGEFLWTPHNNHFGWSSLLGAAPGSPDVSPYAAAARASDLSRLPPTFLSVGALDLFLEEDLDYARRLTRAGVPVEFHLYPGGFHAFDMMPGAQVSDAARRDSRDALARALHPRGR